MQEGSGNKDTLICGGPVAQRVRSTVPTPLLCLSFSISQPPAVSDVVSPLLSFPLPQEKVWAPADLSLTPPLKLANVAFYQKHLGSECAGDRVCGDM